MFDFIILLTIINHPYVSSSFSFISCNFSYNPQNGPQFCETIDIRVKYAQINMKKLAISTPDCQNYATYI